MFDRFNFNAEDRVVMMFATQEARDLGHRGLGNDHLILGMLGNARSPLFAVLGEQGLTLDAARAAVRGYHAEHADDLAAADEATAAQRYEEDREALASIGIDLDKVRAAVGERFGDDLADTWGERRERGRGRNRGPGHGHRHGHGHGRGHGRGFGPGAFGPGGPGGFGPGGPGFGPGGPGFGGPGGPGFGPGGPGGGPEGPEFGAGFGPDGDGPWEGGRGRRGPRGRGGRPRMGQATRDAMRAAVRLTRECGDDTLRAEYLLLGILEAGDPASVALIESATTVDALRAAVLATLPEVAADA